MELALLRPDHAPPSSLAQDDAPVHGLLCGGWEVTMPSLPKACIIGAGSSGITVVKAFAERGIPFDCFEKSDGVGGNWVFGNRNGQSRIYRSLHINTSRDRMAYADFPMPKDYPDFPHHALMARYFAAYADRFGLKERITFETEVTRAERLGPRQWRVTLDSGEVRAYDVLIVANGHHWDPRWPAPPIPGRFAGTVLHAHDYVDPRQPHDMHGQRIVVVGMGNSAMDIACELCRPGIAERLYLSARRGAWIVPNYILGRPIDQLQITHAWVPWRVQSLIAELLLRVVVGAPWRFGLPKPDHRPLAAHPTISQDLLVRLGRGDIVPKPGIAALQGNEVRFVDGSIVEADVIVYCTGYKVSFPFFDPGFLSAPGNDLPLWRRLARPGEDDLFFVGLAQPLGAIMPIAEAQAKLIGDLLLGRYALPPAEAMRAEMEREQRARRARFVASPRHTMEIDFDRYLHELARERQAGERRAAQR
jgi:cation diffusion facilitator CzcD-associated flavoprotein CzcO